MLKVRGGDIAAGSWDVPPWNVRRAKVRGGGHLTRREAKAPEDVIRCSL